MENYKYKGINENGKYVKGIIAAQNSADLAKTLKESKIDLVSYKITKKVNSSIGNNRFSINKSDLISIFIHLEQLERAGVSIIESVTDLKDSSDNKKIRRLMLGIYESIKDGNLFSESLAKYPEIFSDVYIGLVKSGEMTGNLADSFANIVDNLKWSVELKRKIRKALVGPLFGLFIMIVVIGIMTTFVIPRVTEFLVAQEISLPILTTSLISLSKAVQKYWYIGIIAPLIIYFIIKTLTLSEKVAIIIDDFKLKIPIIGPILNKIDAARFSYFFSMTFKSGLGVIECLNSAKDVIKNRAIAHSITVVMQQVTEGKPLSTSIELTGYFPSLVSRMFKIGEHSGNMENALKNIRFFYDQQITDSIDRLVSMIQPALTITMGGMMLWITLAVFGPIYSSFGKL